MVGRELNYVLLGLGRAQRPRDGKPRAGMLLIIVAVLRDAGSWTGHAGE